MVKDSLTWHDLTFHLRTLVSEHIRDVLTSRNYLLYGLGLETVENVSVEIIDSIMPRSITDSLHVAVSYPRLTAYDDTYLYESSASAVDTININIYNQLNIYVKNNTDRWIQEVEEELTHD